MKKKILILNARVIMRVYVFRIFFAVVRTAEIFSAFLSVNVFFDCQYCFLLFHLSLVSDFQPYLHLYVVCVSQSFACIKTWLTMSCRHYIFFLI